MRSKVRARTACVLALALAMPSALAQETPGAVGDTLKRPQELKRPEAPAVVEPRAARTPPAPTGDQRTVVILGFRFVGNTVFTAEQLLAPIRGYLGRPVTLLQIYEAADKVADVYVRNGYTLASVSVPAQTIATGVVLLEVFEGRLGTIHVEGSTSYDAAQIAGFLAPVRPGEIYRAGSLQSGMERLNDLPGMNAKAVLQPGQQYGTSDVVIQAEEDRFAGTAFIDNHGRENIGEYRLGATATLNNPLRVGDRVNFVALVSEDALLTYGYGEYSLPATLEGSRLNLSYGRADFEIEGEGIQSGDFEGQNEVFRVALQTPWIEEGGRTLATSVGGSYTNANVDFTGETFSETKLGLFEASAAFSRQHGNFAVTQLVLSLASNFGEGDPAEGDYQPVKLEVDVQHLRPLPANFEIFGRVNGAISPDPLPDTSKFSIGGPNSVRGYPASELRGDKGVQGTLALQRSVGLGAVRVKGRVFADAGYVYTLGSGGIESSSDSLTSVGVGADTYFPRDILLRLDAAFPLDDREVSDGRDDGRVFGSLNISF